MRRGFYVVDLPKMHGTEARSRQELAIAAERHRCHLRRVAQRDEWSGQRGIELVYPPEIDLPTVCGRQELAIPAEGQRQHLVLVSDQWSSTACGEQINEVLGCRLDTRHLWSTRQLLAPARIQTGAARGPTIFVR